MARLLVMPDAHDLHVLHDLIAAVRATPGAPAAAADELERQAGLYGAAEAEAGGRSVIEAARDALGGLIGRADSNSVGMDDGGELQRLAALLGRMEAAMQDDRLSGPARDAVIRAFDPVKAARDAALQRAEGV